MAILIADSGSTKTEWILLEKEVISARIRTRGLNPYFIKQDEMREVLKGVKEKTKEAAIERIYFYGSGCSGITNQEIVRNLFSEIFGKVTCEIHSDLLGAARALFETKKGIACILGTGSNTCYYDGEKIVEQVPSLGFMLGDEGSGGYFGKQILRDYYYKNLPKDIDVYLKEEYEMELEHTLEKLYQKDGANAYVASFAEILVSFSDYSYVRKLVQNGLNDFIDRQLAYLKDVGTSKVGMVGSIAYVHQNIIKEILENAGYSLENVIQSPIEYLADYYRFKDAKK